MSHIAPGRRKKLVSKKKIEDSSSTKQNRMPLKIVVSDCERRWFDATLKAAKTGDALMQTLVGQMFCSGYGVAADINQGKLWLQKSAGSDEDARRLLASLSGDQLEEQETLGSM